MRFCAAIVLSLLAATCISANPYCRQEQNIDYVGNDIANKPSSLEDCCILCLTTEGCSAWSWSTHLGGTCWMKSGISGRVNKQGVISGYEYNLSYCPEEENVDYVNHDIGNRPSSSSGACCEICNLYPGCRAYTWSNHNGGTCWLKSKKGSTSWNPHVKSAVLSTTPPPPQCSLVYGVDYVGNDIGNIKATDPGLCCDLCRDYSGCRAFSWSTHNGGTCWFKSAKTGTTPIGGVVSSEISKVQCNYKNGTDYVNHDIGNKKSSDVKGCCNICATYPGCNAFSWNDHQGGTCWLKSKIGDHQANTNVSSGSLI